ncbi:hypothetical protein PALA111701_11890 [Paenibacillus lactis]
MNTALVIVDIQNDYFKGGRNELYNSDEAAARAQEALSCSGKRIYPLSIFSASC